MARDFRPLDFGRGKQPFLFQTKVVLISREFFFMRLKYLISNIW